MSAASDEIIHVGIILQIVEVQVNRSTRASVSGEKPGFLLSLTSAKNSVEYLL